MQELFKCELQYYQRQVSTTETSIRQLTILIVVARFRPQNKIELASDGKPIVEFQSKDTCSIQVQDIESSRHQAQILILLSRARPMLPSRLIVSST